METKSLKELQAEFRVIQSLLCEIRSKVDGLASDARALWEAEASTEEDAVWKLWDELEQLSDVLSNWEGE